VPLSSVSVSDPTLGAVTCPAPPAGGLAPGASGTCAANKTYTVTLADQKAGSISDTATATGTTPGGVRSAPSQPSTAMVPTAPITPAYSIVKEQKIANPAPAPDNNDRLTVETRSSSSASHRDRRRRSPSPARPATTFTCSHVITAADETAGTYGNTASITGTPTTGGQGITNNSNTVVTDVTAPGPSIANVRVRAVKSGFVASLKVPAGSTVSLLASTHSDAAGARAR
jgi:hypothetical protein